MPLGYQHSLAFPDSSLFSICSLLPPLLHGQDLHHADEDVDEVEFERDGLVDGIASEHASFGHSGVGEDLLGIVEGEAAEDGQSVDLVSIIHGPNNRSLLPTYPP